MKTSRFGCRSGRSFPFTRVWPCAVGFALALGAASTAAAVEINPLGRLGFHDAEHTAADGLQRSQISSFNEPGVTAGISLRYLGGPSTSPRGQSAWLADPAGAMTQVGFDDAAHTAPNGTQTSDFVALHRSGLAIGYTVIPGGGRSAWLASIADGTRRLGFFDGIHAAGGELAAPFSSALDVNASGTSVGYSARQDGGRTAWVSTPGGPPIAIGLFDADHTSPEGVQDSVAIGINEAGYVIGSSQNYVAEVSTGWLRTPGGEMLTFPMASLENLTDEGWFSLSASPPSPGDAAVGHASGSIRPVGFPVSDDPEVESSERNTVRFINAQGAALGTYTNHSLRGQVIWIDAAGYGTLPLQPEGYGSGGPGGSNHPVALNDSAYAVAYSERYDGAQLAWLGDAAGNVRPIGLYEGIHRGAEHEVFPGGMHTSEAQGLTNSNLAWGFSARYHGDNTAEGQTAWIYDIANDAYVTLEISVRPSDGYAFSTVHQVLENGIAFGTYTRFDAAGTDLGERAFLWLPNEGVIDLADNLSVPVEAAGWEYLGSPLAGNLDGRFVGHAVPVNSNPASQGVYLVALGDDDVPPPPPSGELEYVAPLGLYNARHTHPSGYRASRLVEVSESGYALGTSALFVGADDVSPATGRLAQTAWVANADGVTTRVGLYNPAHTRDDGRQENTPVALNENGFAIGHAARFSGHAYRGESAWIASPTGAAVRLGYIDPAHTGANGSRFSLPVALNNGNLVVGYSRNPDTDHTSAWLGNVAGTLTRLGLLDAAHTAPDGTRVSLPVDINDAGHVIGISEYYVPGSTTAGHTTWVRQPWGALRIVGFQGGEHRAPNGLHDGTVEFLTENGVIAGHAVRYHPNQNQRVGQTAWLTHVAGRNRRVGFYTGIHAGANHVAYSRILGLNEAGYGMGFSSQFPYQAANEAAARGRTAWIARPDGTSVKVGLYQAAYTMDQYYQWNQPRAQNESDGVAGTARVGSAVDQGLDAWFARASTGVTVRLRLPGDTYVRGDGSYWRHVPTHMTNSLLVGGTSARFAGMSEVGQTAWIYDHATQTFVTFDLSVRSTDNFAWSRITTLREDGFATGIYRKFAPNGASLGDRAFVFIPGQGAVDMGSALDINLADEGWALLADPHFVTGQGLIVGSGVIAGYGPGAPPRQFAEGVYLLRRNDDQGN